MTKKTLQCAVMKVSYIKALIYLRGTSFSFPEKYH